jgi:hypothetical protein
LPQPLGYDLIELGQLSVVIESVTTLETDATWKAPPGEMLRARQTRRGQISEYCFSKCSDPLRYTRASARESLYRRLLSEALGAATRDM